MTDKEKNEEGKGLIERFRTSRHPVVAFARELLWVVAVVAGIALVLFLVSGTWPAVVTIESESMAPHMNVGDLVFVVRADRLGELQTWESGKATGYLKFGDSGDVLIFTRNGAAGSLIPGLGGGVHPIIHRAMAVTPDASRIPVYYYFFRGQAALKSTCRQVSWIMPGFLKMAPWWRGLRTTSSFPMRGTAPLSRDIFSLQK